MFVSCELFCLKEDKLHIYCYFNTSDRYKSKLDIKWFFLADYQCDKESKRDGGVHIENMCHNIFANWLCSNQLISLSIEMYMIMGMSHVGLYEDKKK